MDQAPPPPPPPFSGIASDRRSPFTGHRTKRNLIDDDEKVKSEASVPARSKMSDLKKTILEDAVRPNASGISSASPSTAPVATSSKKMASASMRPTQGTALRGISEDGQATVQSPGTQRRKFAGSRIMQSFRRNDSARNLGSDHMRESLTSHLSRRSNAIRSRVTAAKDREDGGMGNAEGLSLVRSTVRRNYNVGDYVLVSVQQSRFANLVNKHGFPPGEGETPEEQRGPYSYLLASIKHKHFEEVMIFYTVSRCDNGMDQRADQEYMEPMRSKAGELAAKRAATAHSGLTTRNENGNEETDNVKSSGCMQVFRNCCYVLLLPFLCLYDWAFVVWLSYVLPTWKRAFSFLKERADLVMNGREPYVCRLRITMVNFMVLCSTWFMFIDQARLAFFPAEADNILAAVSMAVWMVLVLELLFEVFVWPDGFKDLIVSDKAYAPTTVRFINGFHLFVESLSLALFVPEFLCIWQNDSCSKRYNLSFYNAVLIGMIGPQGRHMFYGHAYQALIRLRVFGLVRHWRNMWITNTFINMKWRAKRAGIFAMLIPSRGSRTFHDRQSLIHRNKLDAEARDERIKELTLINASNIGTALMVTNSYRAMIILWAITGLFPILGRLGEVKINRLGYEMTEHLQTVNLFANDTAADTCEFLRSSIDYWSNSLANLQYGNGIGDDPFLLAVDVRPYRCGLKEGIPSNFAACDNLYVSNESLSEDCVLWWTLRNAKERENVADELKLRQGSILQFSAQDSGSVALGSDGSTAQSAQFSVNAMFDHSRMIQTASFSSFLLQILLLFSVLGGLSFLRRDAEILVLGPLRRMLKIVARYAKNPLMPPSTRNVRSGISRKGSKLDLSDDADSDDESDEGDAAGLGSYETEQLITAVTNITDLLRKCWGVAGADIISTNLATREGALKVFNPTVPGKSVYALFSFAAISGFDHALRNLKGDVMKLINDVAKVLHDEVFRWGFGESGQCNKNLGSAFLMVFRIGLVEEVIEKLEQAQDVIWSGQSPGASKRRAAPQRQKNSMTKATQDKQDRRVATKAMGLSLQSLPGISNFTDRAVVGMLKSFAGIYRDQKVLDWSKDFRLSAGVGAFKVSLIYGMDAGWAVEGAVGSEYKIDATYLSPHVNMASRMTGACKQYGVNIMLSQAVQELMSEGARSRLRHLDTVTVKGSSVIQKIYTFDCKAKGVDFFLHGRSDEQADLDAHQFSADVWTNDQDLRAMGQHVTDDFLKLFQEGHRAYIKGDWPKAIELLERANDTMFETAVEEGYLEDEFDELQIYAGQDFTKAADDLKRENGDGPSIFLISFMKSYAGVAPDDWEGWHPLTRK